MIQQELIKVRKEIKKIRRSKKIRAQRTSYITMPIFLQRIYFSAFYKKQESSSFFFNRQERLKEISAKKYLFNKYSIKQYIVQSYSKLNLDKEIYCFEIKMLKTNIKKTFRLLEHLVLENFYKKIKSINAYLVSKNNKDIINKLSEIEISKVVLDEPKITKFNKKLSKFIKYNIKIIEQKTSKDPIITVEQLEQDSIYYNKGFFAKDYLLQGDIFLIRFYIIWQK